MYQEQRQVCWFSLVSGGMNGIPPFSPAAGVSNQVGIPQIQRQLVSLFTSGSECDLAPPYQVNNTAKGRYNFDSSNPKRSYEDEIRYW